MSKTSLIQSTGPLIQEQPDYPVGRTDERQRIRAALHPRAGPEPAAPLWVFGPAGIGKTTCVRHVLDQIESETGTHTVYINCWQYNTRPALLTELLIQCGYPAPRKGKPVDELLSRLRELLGKSRGFAVALDEFDQLRDATEIIYDFHLLRDETDHALGLTLVSNQGPANHEFDPRSESRLTCQTLEFHPYTAAELVDILEQRVGQAFRSGAVADSAVELIAETVAEQGGDCREALDLLLRAGRRADQEREQRVTQDTVNAILDSP